MPTYEYKCKECLVEFEVNRSMSESSLLSPCPSGHTNVVKKLSLFSATGKVEASAMSMCGSPTPGSCGSGCGCCA